MDYKINQVSKMLGVHKDTLREWEEKHLIDPARRDPSNQYRLYNEEEIWEIARRRGIGTVDFEAVIKK